MVVTFSWEKAKVDDRGRIVQERVGLANQEFHFEQVTFEKLRKHPNRVLSGHLNKMAALIATITIIN